MRIWRPWASELLRAEVGGAALTAALAIIALLAATICPVYYKWLLIAAVGLAFVAFVLWRARTPYAYLVADPADLANPDADKINLWLIATGYLPQVHCHVSPMDSAPGYSERYKVLGEGSRKQIWTDVSHGDRMGDLFVPVSQANDWRIEFTARDNGWKEQLTFKRRSDQTWEQSIVLKPDAVLWWQKPTFVPKIVAPSPRQGGVL